MGFDVSLTEAPRGWELADPAEMLDTLQELSDESRFGTRFRGSVCVWRVKDGMLNPEGELQWYLEVTDGLNPNQTIRAVVGEYLLFMGNVLQHLDAQRFSELTGQGIPTGTPDIEVGKSGEGKPLKFERGKGKA